jgi:hypothetical protein
MNTFRHTSSVIINDETAYEQGRQRAIKANARRGREARWLAEDATREVLVAQLARAAYDARPGSFLAKMGESLEEWGTLTAGQEAAIRKIFAQDAERAEVRKAERAEAAAKSEWVGTVGERREFALTVTFATAIETQFGTLHILGLKDEAGNIVIYKGSAPFADKGQTVTVKATIKEHGVRDGAKQTIIARPKVAA